MKTAKYAAIVAASVIIPINPELMKGVSNEA